MALNLGFTPQYRPNEQLFVSCGRQNPSAAASTIRQLNDRVPVFYDNGAQGGIPEKMANSCAVLFFADSALFGGEDADMRTGSRSDSGKELHLRMVRGYVKFRRQKAVRQYVCPVAWIEKHEIGQRIRQSFGR